MRQSAFFSLIGFRIGRAAGLVLLWLAFSGCSESPQPEAVAPGVPEQTGEGSEAVAEVQEKGDGVDPTLMDQAVPAVVLARQAQEAGRGEEEGLASTETEGGAGEAEEGAPEGGAGLHANGYRYSDMPETREEQRAFSRELKRQLKNQRRGLIALRARLIQDNPQLAEWDRRLAQSRQEVDARVEASDRMRELEELQAARMAHFEHLGHELAELKAQADGKTVKRAKPVMRCCGTLVEEPGAADAPPPRSEVLLEERRNLLGEMSLHTQEKVALYAEITESDPQIRALREEQEQLEAQLAEAIHADPAYREASAQLTRLRNKSAYVSRVVMGDPRYLPASPAGDE